jgi:alanyl-tRNA synthetase
VGYENNVEVLKKSAFIVHGAEKIKDFIVPHVLRLVKLIRAIYKSRVPFSKKNVFIRDNFTCQYCGSHEVLTIDHVMPVSRGGKTDFAQGGIEDVDKADRLLESLKDAVSRAIKLN